MIQGCRPSSAVHQPAVVAMYGNGDESMRIQSIRRDRCRVPRQRNSAAAEITSDQDRPQAHHDVVRVVEQLHVVAAIRPRGSRSAP